MNLMVMMMLEMVMMIMVVVVLMMVMMVVMVMSLTCYLRKGFQLSHCVWFQLLSKIFGANLFQTQHLGRCSLSCISID